MRGICKIMACVLIGMVFLMPTALTADKSRNGGAGKTFGTAKNIALASTEEVGKRESEPNIGERCSKTVSRGDPVLLETFEPPYDDEKDDPGSTHSWVEADKNTGDLDGFASAQQDMPFTDAEGWIAESWYKNYPEGHYTVNKIVFYLPDFYANINGNLLWSSGGCTVRLKWVLYNGETKLDSGTIWEKHVEASPKYGWEDDRAKTLTVGTDVELFEAPLDTAEIRVVEYVFASRGSGFCSCTLNTRVSLIELWGNHLPDNPMLSGLAEEEVGEPYELSMWSENKDWDPIRYRIDWGDGDKEWTDYHPSGERHDAYHTYNSQGTYTIRVKAQDVKGGESQWSDLEVSVPKSKEIQESVLAFFENLFNKHSYLSPMLSGDFGGRK